MPKRHFEPTAAIEYESTRNTIKAALIAAAEREMEKLAEVSPGARAKAQMPARNYLLALAEIGCEKEADHLFDRLDALIESTAA